ncbi:hypothetical protein RhiirA5_504576 [Rhizophagus irregularis]|uniref:Uncharacterized protein n=3 Tax=Rhizophagus irregularis TaxID=588596 RepID=A0A2I1EAP5_9GLOM|nr:hypothetical protein GLOIN_2v1522960 [Rhizophagus irregularis DAOM 181602=DAOM 197198]EXX50984.1 hypothetical protein RirG_265720 [Rhizophagus irregularis DAOM 197198w]PKC01509.1 hypothetical protein RhiirA5_504576 [Rhizophagus irregularis]PKC62830.1 hypothetical protein RhiirA1_538215 [Rhizophagus irregularis]PKK57377.1 hypothetical protein RhiirC2_798143 [Rhizophagus irregularis]PKY19173.1 hypothetical protein RhiirB3_523315 [Rhizophagus irregularis]|eukprot:XP_025186615.1 hypothetical protein GLOIN_2v1522960 [Rhizophagus irregularis DAOM 181602=DAOM 197198]
MNTDTSDVAGKKPSIKKGRWCKKDDDFLAHLVSLESSKPRWRHIAEKFGSRSGKQCRERWENHLKNGIVKRRFTAAESAFIHNEVERCRPEAPKWALISAKLVNSTPLMVRNHVNNYRRKRTANALKHRRAKLYQNRSTSKITVNLMPKPQNPPITKMSVTFLLN